MEVRPMRKEDRTALIELWHACGLTRPWNDPDRDIDLATGAGDAAILVGEEGKRLIGCVMVGFDGHRGWVYYLGVAPDRQRRGHGRAMFAAAQVWLEARGAPKIQLMLREDNAEARHFYEALGLELQPVVTLGRRLG
jgi:ribosomal protein S18 acetylase RimI-like enzyme